MASVFQGAAGSLAFFIEGLTLVCIIGTSILWGIFGFLYVVERQLNAKKAVAPSGENLGKGAR